MIDLKPQSRNKILAFAATLTTLFSSVLAHSDQNQSYGSGIMWGDGGWMHNGRHMAGYNMWGMGWFGVLFGLAFWILVILGIIYLYQEVTENRGEE